MNIRLIQENRRPKIKFFDAKEVLTNFNSKNDFKNELKDNDEKSFSLSINNVSKKINQKRTYAQRQYRQRAS